MRGGLGNQLFQWAAGFALAEKVGTELKLDTSVFERNTARKFELDRLGIQLTLATPEEVSLVRSDTFYKQPYFHYDSRFSDLGDNTFIRGYFCSHRYFESAATAVSEVLNKSLLNAEFTEAQKELFDLLSTTYSVSIHVRRGDYISNADYNNFFGSCSIDYYNEAMKSIEKMLPEPPTYFVFSDDISWAIDNIKSAHSTVFADVNQGGSSYLDMLFMSRCKHNIIANSTFSWWGAWINSHPNKIVIAPKKWFNQNYRNNSGRGNWIKNPYYRFDDVYPSRWVTL